MESKLSRIKTAIAYLKGKEIIVNQNDIVKAIGYSKSTVSMALNGKEKYFTDSFIDKFASTFNINKVWIHSGTGEMVESENGKIQPSPEEKKPESPSTGTNQVIQLQQKLIASQEERIKLLEKDLKECKEELFFKDKPVPRDNELKS